MKDAQQQIIDELRAEIAEAVKVEEKLGAMQRHVARCRQITRCPDDETLAEWLEGCIRLDDPVVTVLVEACNRGFNIAGFYKDEQFIEQALSAYEARVKEVVK